MAVRMPNIDWCNLDEVIAFAEQLGKGMTVYANELMCCYNITHTSRRDMWDRPHMSVMYQTI